MPQSEAIAPHKRAFVIVFVALIAVALPMVQPPDAQAQGTAVVINEFLAINASTNVDNNGEFEDWIELHNTTGSAVDLGGWIIADGAESFTLPAGTVIDAGAFLLLWASGDVSRTAPGFLHLPFKLNSDGEALTLRNQQGVLTNPAWLAPNRYPPQVVDDSYGVASGGAVRYFTSPTPGAANGGGVAGRVEPVTFSVPHGFYQATQQVVLDTPTPASTIWYSTDGSTPTVTSGTALAPGTAIPVSETTVIRAIATRSGWSDSTLEARSYFFTADIVTQSTDAPAGWPDDNAINGMRASYGIDPDLSAADLAAVEQALVAIPSISITTDLDNFFDPDTGIWTNPRERGAEWEKPISIELIDPTGAQPGFDINGGLRVRGNSSRSPENFKHSMRLVFNEAYGDGELDYPLFGDEGVDIFESVDLKTAQSWSWNQSQATRVGRGTEATWLRDVWNRDSQGAMGQPYARGRFVHAFINGQYWGLYMTEERVSNQHAAQYTGGNEADFDIVKRNTGDPSFTQALHVEARDGTLDDWLSLWPLVEDHSLTNAEWAVFRDEVDLENLADFYLLLIFSGDSDSSPRYTLDRSNNWLAFRNRSGVGSAARWHFNDRDSESALCTDVNVGREPDWNPTPPWDLDSGLGDYLPPENFLAPAWLFEAALTQPEFVQIFQDRVQLHMLTPGGALTVSESVARLDARSAIVDLAVDGEAARWGDTWDEPGFGRADWEQATETVRDCFQLRTDVVEGYLREDGLWPDSDPPQISPAGGPVPYASAVEITGTGGTLWFTLDGTDPRAINGTPSATALQYTGLLQISGDTTVRARIELGVDQWSPLAEESYSLSSPAGPVGLVLNEFNAVASGNYLGGGTAVDIGNGTDVSLGRVAGNGGDWFELMVVEDGLDIRGWTVEVWNESGGVLVRDAAVTFGQNAVFQDLFAGSVVTVSEDIIDDASYSPVAGDWHINAQSNSALDGALITSGSQSNFAINNSDTQIAIFDASGIPVQLRTGEGTAPGAGVSSTEVFKLEGTPSSSLTPDSVMFDDGTSSSWGLANVWDDGASSQDVSTLRVMFGDADCNQILNVLDAVAIAQETVGLRTGIGSCDGLNVATEMNLRASDANGDGSVNVLDAVTISQCVANLNNILCP